MVDVSRTAPVLVLLHQCEVAFCLVLQHHMLINLRVFTMDARSTTAVAIKIAHLLTVAWWRALVL